MLAPGLAGLRPSHQRPAVLQGVYGTTHLLEGLHQPLSSSQRFGDSGAGSSAANYGTGGEEVHGTVRTLDETGFLGPGTTLAHGVHLSAGDMALLAERGCTVSHNPISNLRLGAGIANLPAMLEAGVNVGLGVDGAGSGVDSQDILVSEQVTARRPCCPPGLLTPLVIAASWAPINMTCLA